MGQSGDSNDRLGRRSLISGSAAVGMFAALAPACCPCAATTHTWNNAIQTAGADPDHVQTPGSLKDLVLIVQKAEREGKRVRMTGSGHSFSDVAVTDDYLLSPTGLGRVLPLERGELKDAASSGHYVRVEAGIRIRELNQHLDRHGLALDNMGGYDAQTIVGAAMTGTHGSGLEYGPIASQIVSLELVTTGGEVLKVEPEGGITKPFDAYHLKTPSGNVPAKLRADTPLFNALTVSLGCMGIVYAVVLKVVPAFYLHEKRGLTTWGELAGKDGLIERVMTDRPIDLDKTKSPTGRDPEHYEIYFSPYPKKRGQPTSAHPCLLTRRYRVPVPIGRTRGQRKRGKNREHVLVAAERVSKQGQALAEFMNDHPDQVPGLQFRSLDALADKDDYVDKSFEVFHLGPLNAMRVTGIEMAFNLGQTITAAERLFAVAKELTADGLCHSSPPSLRFVKKADAELAMMNGRRTTMLEMGMLVCANGAEDLLRRYERTYIDELGARPHWGLDLNVFTDFAQVEALYGDSARRWRRVFEAMNRLGTFDGAFTDRLGISMRPRPIG